MQELIEFKMPSHLLYVSSILAFARRLAQQIGFSQTRMNDITSVLDEVCSNAIEHGSRNASSRIELTFFCDSSQLEVLVRDKGQETQNNWLIIGWVNKLLQERTPGSERGHGIYLARKLSDHMEMQPNSHGGTDVRVTFALLVIPESVYHTV
jgi:anti-sigma regulatory factor (Ser/Thr protein kinase)